MSANVELSGIDTALRRQITKRLYNAAYATPSFLGLLMGMDMYYNRKAKGKVRVDKLGIKGGKMQTGWWTQLPTVEGVNAMSPDAASRILPFHKNAVHKAGTMDASAMHGLERVDKYEVNRMVGDDAIADYVSQVADRGAEAIILKLNEWIFPAANQSGGLQTYGNQIDRIMSLAYPLQSGYTNNALTPAGSETYNYLGVNLNDNTSIKAVNYGTTSSTVTSSVSNIRKYLLAPLQARGAKIDVLLMGLDDFDYFCRQAELTIQQPYSEEMALGTQYARFGNIFIVYEPRIDLLTYKEIYALDTSTWKFGWSEDVFSSFKLVTDIPGAPSFDVLQFYMELALVCAHPRFNGRLFNTVTS